jgi:alanyl-tRNA synthetase
MSSRKPPFYGESGGQVGTRAPSARNGDCPGVDTTKTEGGLIVHKVRLTDGRLSKNQDVKLCVDASRRKSIMRHHSATHLFRRRPRGAGRARPPVGLKVNDARLRFDFTHSRPFR